MNSSNFARYDRATLNTPGFHFIIKPLLPYLQQCLGFVYWLRWQLSRPLQVKVLPKWMPSLNFFGLINLSFITYGEILLALPLLGLVMAGFYYSFFSPHVVTSGNIASYAIIIAFLTANKSTSLFSFALGIPFERLLAFHKITAFCAVVLGAIHTHVVFSMEQGDMSIIDFTTHNANNMLGSLIFVSLALFSITSFFPILRRWNYDLWLCTHIVLAITISLPWAVHSVNLVWLPLFWFVLDWVVRYGIMAGCRYRAEASIRQLHADVIEVKFPKPAGFDYNAGQFVRIAVPKITAFQFHPFSIASAPHEDHVTLHVRALGNWTCQLMELAKQKEFKCKIWIEGPYGAPSVDLNSPRYGMVLFVCGGTGVTPCRSIIRSLVNSHRKKERRFEKLRFIWSIRDQGLIKELPLFGRLSRMLLFRSQVFSPSNLGDDDSSVSTSNQQPTPVKNDRHSFVQTEVYLTSMMQNVDMESCDFGVTSNHVVTIQGRPDLDLILTEMADEAKEKNITHIAVIGCGPRSLLESLKEKCRKHSKGLFEREGVYFDVHEEVFEF